MSLETFRVPSRFWEVMLAFEWEGYRYLTTTVVQVPEDWAAVLAAEARTVVAFVLPEMHPFELLRVRAVREEEAVVLVRSGARSWGREKIGASLSDRIDGIFKD